MKKYGIGLLSCVLLAATPSVGTATTILLVSDNNYSGSRAGTGDSEAEMESFLTGLGYSVIRATGEGGTAQFHENNEGAAGAAAVGADLILVSRVANSGGYDESDSGAAWNAISTPILLLSPYIARANRWQWVTGGNGVQQGALTDIAFEDPNHPFVNGLGTDMFDTATTFSRNDVGFADVGNGTLIASDGAGRPALVEWQAGVPFSAGGQTPGGRRVLMGSLRYHEDDGAGPVLFSAYSDNGLAILGQTIQTLAPIPEPGSSLMVAFGVGVLFFRRRR